MRILNTLVRKSNALIESSYQLTLIEQKILLLLASRIRRGDKAFKLCKIKISEFIEMSGKSHHNYREIEETIVNMIGKNLRIIILDEHNISTTINTSWLSSSRYKEGSGFVELCFDPALKPFLLNLSKCFTSFKLKNTFLLQSSYAIRVYELLKQYEKISQRFLTLAELRRILKIPTGIYKLYGHFKQKVLIKAQKELLARTDIYFEFKEIKNGRKVSEIQFFIYKNTPKVSLLDISPIRDICESKKSLELNKLIALLPSQYQAHSTIANLLKTHLDKKGFDYVARNIEYTNANSNAIRSNSTNKKKSNYRGYLNNTLDNDFGLAYQEDQAINIEKEELLKEQNKLKEKLASEKRKQEKADKAALVLLEEQKELAKRYISSLSSSQLEELEHEAINAIDEPMKSLITNKKMGWQTTLKLKVNEIIRNRLFPN